MNFKNYIQELKRRNVFKAALAYIVVSWIVLQVISIVFPILNIPETISKAVLVVLLIGFPVWLVFAWVYEVTPEGLRKTEKIDPKESITSDTGNKFNRIILGALVVAIILLGANLYRGYSEPDEEGSKNSPIITPDSPESEEKSIAVLAFADMSPEKDQEYFSDGISEEILNYLAKNGELTVISRTSSFSFKGKNQDIREIGSKLNANYILEGSVRKADSTLRITAQLIHVTDGAHIWSETYDRKMNDIFKIQDEIAEAVTKNLEASLLGEELKTVDTEAYNKYLQAKYLWNQFSKQSLEKAQKLIKEAILIDDTYAPAWLLQARISQNLGGLNMMVWEEVFGNASTAVKKALSLDPDYAEAYAFWGRLELINLEYKKAEKNFKRALELAPQDPRVLILVSQLPTLTLDDRIKILNKSLKLDPLNYNTYFYLSTLYFYKKDFQKSLEAQEKYEVYFPNSFGNYSYKAEILAQLGREKEAFEELQKEEDEFLKAYGTAIISVILYHGEKANKELESFKRAYGDEHPYLVTQLYAWENKREKAFIWLNKVDITGTVYISQFSDDFYLDNLKNDLRWEEFVKKTGFPGRSKLQIPLN